jgi:hypothetical protein
MRRAILNVLLCLTPALSAAAGSAASDWSGVRNVSEAREVQVRLRSGKALKGTLREWQPEGVTFVAGNSVISLKREDIAAISAFSRGKGSKRGAAIGLASGAAVGAASGPLMLSVKNRAAASFAGALLDGAIWGAIGAAIGAGTRATETIYKAGPPNAASPSGGENPHF